MKFASPLSTPSKHTADLLATLILLATAFAIYGQTIGYPFISFDDPAYVVHNTHVNHGLTWEGWKWAWTSLDQSNWHPLTWLSLMLDATFYDLNAGGYHLTNVLLHAASGILVFRWLRGITDAWWPAALTAFFFVAHPLHVESVAWVTERKDVLSTLFFFLTLLAWTRYVRGGGRRFYALALALYILGLTAKPMLVTLPPLLLLLDYWPLQRCKTGGWRSLLLEKVPFAALAGVSCVITVIAQRRTALVPLVALPPSHRVASAALGYGTYLTKTLLPLDLGIYYPYWRAQSMIWPECWAAALVVVTLAVLFVRRSLPFLMVGWCWFLGMLVPVIGVVQVGGQAVADRYVYVPHVGLFIAVFWTGAALWARCGKVGRGTLATLAGAAAAGAVGLSYHQTGYWRNSAALFERTVSVVRPTGRLYFMLGNALVETNQPAKATEAYLQSWRLGYNGEDTTRPLGTLLLTAHRWREAVEVLEPVRGQPVATGEALNNLALALANTGRGDEALVVYRECVERFPDYALAHFGWAELLQSRGEIADAAAQDEAGLLLRGDWVPALLRLGWNYAHSADPQTRGIGLVLAQQAVDQTGGQDLGSLQVLAFNQAVNDRWEEAVATASRALETARRTKASAEVEGRARERLESYQQRHLPP